MPPEVLHMECFEKQKKKKITLKRLLIETSVSNNLR